MDEAPRFARFARAYREARVRLFGPMGPPGPSAWAQVLERIEPTAKQVEILGAEDRELLVYGGFGSAKTVGLCLNLVKRASVPGAREGLFRKELVTLKKTTLRTLLEGDGPKLPPIAPPGSYHHRKVEQVIDFAPSGGGVIEYSGLSGDADASRVRGLILSGVHVDQAEELSDDDIQQLSKRSRREVPGLRCSNFWWCNPDAPEHPLAVRFGISEGAAPPGYRPIKVLPDDNPHLPAWYLADLENMPELSKQRYRFSLWIAATGTVFGGVWDARCHSLVRRGPWVRQCVSCDPAYGHKAGIHLLRMDAEGWVHVEEEVWQAGMLNEQKRAHIREFVERGGGRNSCPVVVDSEDAELIAELQGDDLQVHRAEKGAGSVQMGTERLLTMLAASARAQGQADNAELRLAIGEAGLTFDPCVVGWRKEIATLQWAPGRNVPKKGNDDAFDSVRYGVVFLTGPFSEKLEVRWVA